MFEVESNNQKAPLKLEDLGFNHISLMVDDIEDVLEDAKRAGAEPLSETHDNLKIQKVVKVCTLKHHLMP